jgi:excinuclease ABC subunit A
VEWDGAVLESLVELLTQVAPDSQFEWRDRQFVRLTLPDQEEPWATIHTKREDAVWLQLHVSQGATARQVTRLGLAAKTARTKSGGTVVRMALQKLADVRNTRLARFLRDHLSSSPV